MSDRGRGGKKQPPGYNVRQAWIKQYNKWHKYLEKNGIHDVARRKEIIGRHRNALKQQGVTYPLYENFDIGTYTTPTSSPAAGNSRSGASVDFNDSDDEMLANINDDTHVNNVSRRLDFDESTPPSAQPNQQIHNSQYSNISQDSNRTLDSQEFAHLFETMNDGVRRISPRKRTGENNEATPTKRPVPDVSNTSFYETEQAAVSDSTPQPSNMVVDNLQETAGTGAGGGVSSAANQEAFVGFPKANSYQGKKYFSYKQKYNKPTKFTGDFGGPDRKCSLKAHDRSWSKANVSNIDVLTINHGMKVIPYNCREASMNPEDWNVPDYVYGYIVHQYGFETTELVVRERPNDKATANAVPHQPATQTKCFLFVDVNNNYGTEKTMDMRTKTICQYFTDRDGQSGATIADLKEQDDRVICIPSEIGQQIICNGWKHIGDTYTHIDPNRAYDMKKQPGYKEFVAVQNELHYTHHPPKCVNLLPNLGTQVAHDWSEIMPTFPDTLYTQLSMQDTSDNGHRVTFWEETANYHTENLDSQPFYKYLNLKHYQCHQDSDARTVNRNNALGRLPIGLAAPGTDNGYTYTHQRSHRNAITNSQTTWRDGHQKAPPNFVAPLAYFGLYNNTEMQSNGRQFYNYTVEGTMNFFCEIEWLCAVGHGSPYPIGIGGLWTAANDTTARHETNCERNVWNQQHARATRRRGEIYIRDGFVGDKYKDQTTFQRVKF